MKIGCRCFKVFGVREKEYLCTQWLLKEFFIFIILLCADCLYMSHFKVVLWGGGKLFGMLVNALDVLWSSNAG